MKFILLIAGLILSTWVSVTIYTPVSQFVTGIKEVYISSQIAVKKTGNTLDAITNTTAYQEIAKMFGIEKAKEAVTTPTKGDKDIVTKFFDHNIALWISVLCGFLTLSVYFNIITFLAFFFKPVTFLMKK
ncbi:MAG: hypothetical protein WC753_00595 [Candidatus Gracilibacteria bacterium]|jgi:hypothetical protein